MKTFALIKTDDDRNYLFGASQGLYHVKKINHIAGFTFGKKSSTFKNEKEAFQALHDFLAKRKDAALLTVTFFPDHLGS